MRQLIIPAIAHGMRQIDMRPRHYTFRDAGDGGVVIFERDASAASAIKTVMPAMTDFIHYRRPPELSDPLRLRFALHRGSVVPDQWGWTGDALWQTFRMLQSEELSEYHRRGSKMASLAITQAVQNELTVHAPTVSQEEMLVLDPMAVRKKALILGGDFPVIIPADFLNERAA